MDRIIAILENINRPGIGKVIEYLRASNFATASCRGHHKYRGGVVDHSLEVYDLMSKAKSNFSEESIAICALLHDIDKSRCKGFECNGNHPERSVKILKLCGLQLTKDEEFAIKNHHAKDCSIIAHPLRSLLSAGDAKSASIWEKKHPKPNQRTSRKLAKWLLLMFSEAKLRSKE